jgi:Domain of unknown function (DUF4296)
MLTFESVKKLLFIFLSALAMISCGEQEEKSVPLMDEPENLIEREKMIQIIADVHVLEAAAGLRAPVPPARMPSVPGQPQPQLPAPPPPPDVTQRQSLPYYDIFTKHRVTREQYQLSYQWYTLDPEEYGLMYDEVINELTRRQLEDQAKGEVALPGSK